MFDIIGDVHGHASELKAILKAMDYTQSGGAWRHPDRQAVFVGDFIDRGPNQVETFNIVRAMIDAGTAQAVMGNHEFNALAWFLPDVENPGEYLRPHDEKNRSQHASFLEQVENDELHKEIIDWAMELPLWLELDQLRVVHACWHEEFMEFLRPKLAAGNRLTAELVAEASRWDPTVPRDGGLSVFNAVETLLKGVEIELPEEHSFVDKDGHTRRHVRTRWWDTSAVTYRAASIMSDKTESSRLPDLAIPEHARFWRDEGTPVFVGHYWFSGTPELQSGKVAVIDYSVAKGGRLVAYRYNGEPTLKNDSLFWVGRDQGARL